MTKKIAERTIRAHEMAIKKIEAAIRGFECKPGQGLKEPELAAATGLSEFRIWRETRYWTNAGRLVRNELGEYALTGAVRKEPVIPEFEPLDLAFEALERVDL
jgi:hypothetical protein